MIYAGGLMLAEVLPDALVGGNPSILADDLHCQDFRITQRRGKAAMTNRLPLSDARQQIIYTAKNSDDKLVDRKHHSHPLDCNWCCI